MNYKSSFFLALSVLAHVSVANDNLDYYHTLPVVKGIGNLGQTFFILDPE